VGADATTGAADVGNAISLGGTTDVAVGTANPAVGDAAATGDAIGETIVGDACGATTVGDDPTATGDACGATTAGDDPTAMGDACGATTAGDAFGAIALGGTFGADTGDALGASTIGCGCGAMATGAMGGNSLPGKGSRTLREPLPCANLMGLPL
jgi:hypothetical protein